MKQRVPFSSIISLPEFQKFKFKYLENVLMRFHEKFATAATCDYLLLIVLTKFLITLSTSDGAWKFFNFRHFKSMTISADKFKVHCLRKVSF